MSRNTENKEEILKVHNRIDLIDQKLDTLENNHLAHMQKDIDRIITYCEKDTIAVAQIFLRLRGDAILEDDEIIHV